MSDGQLTYSLRQMTHNRLDLQRFQESFLLNSSRPRTIRSLEWQYLENGSNKLFVDVADQEQAADGGFAAIYATLPIRCRVGGVSRLALQSLDTLTSPAYRGRGLFITLAKRVYERAEGEGAALVYGFPNGSSAPGFFSKLAWHSLDPVPFLIRPLAIRYAADRLKLRSEIVSRIPNISLVNPFTGRLGQAPDIETLVGADHRVTRLWERFAKHVNVAVERDAEYLQWRLFDKPAESYRTMGVARGGEFDALCSFTVKDKHGGRIGYVMELLCSPSIRGLRAASRLLGAAVRAMAAAGADSALAWCMEHSFTFPVFIRHLFLPLPLRLRPIELHLGVRAFDAPAASLVNQRTAWYISYLDSDTV